MKKQALVSEKNLPKNERFSGFALQRRASGQLSGPAFDYDLVDLFAFNFRMILGDADRYRFKTRSMRHRRCCYLFGSAYHHVMTEFLFRNAGQSDFAAILTLNEASVRFLSPLDLAKLTRLSKEPIFFRIALSAEIVAGFLLAFLPEAIYGSPNFLWFKARYENFAYIDRIVVSDAFRGRRLATSLYAELEKSARGRGIPRLVCEINVDPPNAVSLRFHQKEGFIEVGRQEIFEPEKGCAKIVSLQVKELGG